MTATPATSRRWTSSTDRPTWSSGGRPTEAPAPSVEVTMCGAPPLLRALLKRAAELVLEDLEELAVEWRAWARTYRRLGRELPARDCERRADRLMERGREIKEAMG